MLVIILISAKLSNALNSSFQCNTDYVPVCGSNNENYENECFLRRDACKQQTEILVVSEGSCPAGKFNLLFSVLPECQSTNKTVQTV